MGPTTAAIIISMSGIFGAILSWLMLDEPFTPRMAAGGLIMFAAMLLSQLTDRRRDPCGPDSRRGRAAGEEGRPTAE